MEYREIFKNLPVDFVTLKDLDIKDEPIEDGLTFEENAVKKANFYSQFTDLPVLAEDSGLEVDHLNGEPGVYSRRWPGHEASDEELIEMLLSKLNGVPEAKRGAQLRVIVALKLSKNHHPVLSEGILKGHIIEAVISKRIPGYPYRSLFYAHKINKVLGELSMEEEAKIAHRIDALGKLKPLFVL